MTIMCKFSILFSKLKLFFRSFKWSLIKKKFISKNSLKDDLKATKALLKNKGYKAIRNFSILTWKYYKEEHRFTLIAKYQGKKYFLKLNTRNENLKNSITVSEKFGNDTDFIPSGESFLLGSFYCYKTTFIPSYTFFEIKSYIKNNISEYIKQAITILDKLNEYKVVHQDLDYNNIIFRKKDKKMMLVDFDNSYSKLIGLNCDKPPFRHAIFHDNGNAFIDDANGFYCIFKSIFKNLSEEEDALIFGELKKLIGRNCLVYRWKD